MSKIKLTGHASGTGVLTVTAPNTSTDRTITLPDSTGTIATTTDVSARLPSITDNGDATAITINSSEKVGIGIADAHHMLHIKENSTSNSLASGVKVQITNEQGAGNFATLRFTGSNQNGFIGYRDGANDQDRRISIGIGADAEHISFSQAGIKFNGDTAAANALDDYEEGTWTPTYQADGTNPTVAYSSQLGFYTKIGQFVMASFQMNTSSVSGGNSISLTLNDLPFTSGVGSGNTGHVSSVRTQNWNSEANCPVGGYIDANSTRIWLFRFKDSDSYNTDTTVKTNDLRTTGDSNQLFGSVFYRTVT